MDRLASLEPGRALRAEDGDAFGRIVARLAFDAEYKQGQHLLCRCVRIDRTKAWRANGWSFRFKTMKHGKFEPAPLDSRIRGNRLRPPDSSLTDGPRA